VYASACRPMPFTRRGWWSANSRAPWQGASRHPGRRRSAGANHGSRIPGLSPSAPLPKGERRHCFP